MARLDYAAGMADPVNIKLGKAKVRGVDPEASGLLNVDIPLEPQPPDEWLQTFGSAPGPMWSISMHPPKLHGNTIRIRPPDNEVDKYIAALQGLVDATNAYYDRDIAPELERQARAKDDAAAGQKRRLEEAQRRLDERGE
jgi:hypothetical protein